MIDLLHILENKVLRYFELLYCLGKTPLLNAAYSGRLETVKFLVSKGSSLEEKDKNGEFYHNF